MLLLLLPGIVAAQAMVENALGVSRAATSAAPAKGAAKAIGGALENLGRVVSESTEGKAADIKPAARSVKSAPSTQPAASAAAEPAPAPVEVKKVEVKYEDPSGIRTGMAYGEIMRRFGPPALMLTMEGGEETLSYSTKGQSLDVTLKDGKVTAVRKSVGS